jgi:hypothetical protein
MRGRQSDRSLFFRAALRSLAGAICINREVKMVRHQDSKRCNAIFLLVQKLHRTDRLEVTDPETSADYETG